MGPLNVKHLAGGMILGCAIFCACVSCAFAQSPDTAPFQIRIVYPTEGMPLPGVENLFVFGSVRPPSAKIFINGLDTPMVRTDAGAWLGRIPVTPGKFSVRVSAVLPDGTETWVVRKLKSPKDGPAGERDTKDRIISVMPEERLWKPPRVGRIVDDTVYLRSGPDQGDQQAGFELRLGKDALVTVVGQVEKSLHVKLSDIESLWIDAYAVKLLPKGTTIPKLHINAWTVTRKDRSTVLRTAMVSRLPCRVSSSLDGMTLTLKIYGGISNTDWVHYAADDPWIQQVAWSHPVKEVYQLEIRLKQPLWGYDVRHEENSLILELRDAPAAPPAPPADRRKRPESPPLSGVVVCVDPGHPPMGATGPLGTPEYAVTWALAQKLRTALEERGAWVILTRTEGETVALPVRVERALASGADLFVSVHANALAPGENPFEKNGFSAYFFNPFSFDLAESIHREFRERIPLRDDGLHYGNLHVLRQTYMPSVLVENAYLIWPPEEELLLAEDFQRECALATAAGIEQFLKDRWDRR